MAKREPFRFFSENSEISDIEKRWCKLPCTTCLSLNSLQIVSAQDGKCKSREVRARKRLARLSHSILPNLGKRTLLTPSTPICKAPASYNCLLFDGRYSHLQIRNVISNNQIKSSSPAARSVSLEY